MNDEFMERMTNDVKSLEKKIMAKKEILKEILMTVEDENERNDRRKKIRNILNCEVINRVNETTVMMTANIKNVTRFEEFTCVEVSIQNRSTESDIVINIDIIPITSNCRWLLFENDKTVDCVDSIGKSSSCTCIIAFSSSVFFNSNGVQLVINCQQVPTNEKKFSSSFYNQITSNGQSQSISLAVQSTDISTTFELKSLDFMEEDEAIRISQIITTCYFRRRVPRPTDLCNFNERYPKFMPIDFEKWHILTGYDLFSGLVVVVSDKDKKRITQVLGRNPTCLLNFIQSMNTCE